MSAARDPEASRQHLGVELSRFRNASGLTQQEVAGAMDWSRSKILRIESGAVAVSTNDLRALLRHYGVQDTRTTNRLTALARAAKRPAWRRRAVDPEVGDNTAGYFEHEAKASVIRQYEPLLIPGLLQTEEYLRAVVADARLQAGPGLERMVQARLHRHELLTRADPAEMFFIIDEAVLRRQVGSGDTMSRQLAHLLELGSRRNISIQVVPFARGIYTGLLGPFVLLDLAERDRLLYLEGRDTRRQVSDDEDQVESYLDHFQQLEHKLATEPEHVAETIDQLGRPTSRRPI